MLDHKSVPTCVTMLGMACLDYAALVRTPPEKLLAVASARLRPARPAWILAYELADGIRYLARLPAGTSLTPSTGTNYTAETDMLLEYAHRLEMYGRSLPTA